jgi:hypothetical protein
MLEIRPILIRFALRMPVALKVMPLLLFLIVHFSSRLNGQTTMGILPVNTNAAGSSVLNTEQWHGIALSLQDYLAVNLARIGTINKLSREQLLLLLKELPPPNSENLSVEAYQSISRKENLHYLFKCSVESFQVLERTAVASISVLIIEGNSGEKFWEKSWKINKNMAGFENTENEVLNEIFKPALDQALNEIVKLNY